VQEKAKKAKARGKIPARALTKGKKEKASETLAFCAL
jgi:hypothetical protein